MCQFWLFLQRIEVPLADQPYGIASSQRLQDLHRYLCLPAEDNRRDQNYYHRGLGNSDAVFSQWQVNLTSRARGVRRGGSGLIIRGFDDIGVRWQDDRRRTLAWGATYDRARDNG